MTYDELKWWIGIAAALVVNSIALKWWLNSALYRLDSKIQEERQARSDYFNRRIEDVRRELISLGARNYELKEAAQQFELRVEQRLSGYPSKQDIKDMLDPFTHKIDNIYTQITNHALNGGNDG